MKRSLFEVGKVVTIKKPLPAECGCGYVAPPGSCLKFLSRCTHQSELPRYAIAEIYDSVNGAATIHKVKLSRILEAA